MPTPEEYDRSRNEIQQQIRDKLGMRVPGSQFKSSSMKGKTKDKRKTHRCTNLRRNKIHQRNTKTITRKIKC